MLVVQDLHILFLYFWIVLDLQFILDLLHNVVYAQLWEIFHHFCPELIFLLWF